MNTIGKTDNGGEVVVMSAEEVREFRKLEVVMEGYSPYEWQMFDGRPLSKEISPVFSAMRLFMVNADNIARMRELVNALGSMVGEPTK